MLRPVSVEVNLLRVIIPLSALFLYPQQRQLWHESCLFCNPATRYLSIYVSITGERTYFKTKWKQRK